MTTRGSAGHVLPLAPVGQAALRAGHDVLVAGQRPHAANVERTGLPFAPVDAPPPERWMPLLEGFAKESIDTGNARMVAEFFARFDTDAALPALRMLVEEWHPDLIVRESWEFASTLVAEQHGIPLVRVGLGLAAVEEQTIGLAAPAVDEARASLGLPPDPTGDRLRASSYLTMVPAALEDPAAPFPSRTHRFRGQSPAPARPLPDWWPGNDGPLVYVSFGSVAAGAHLPFYPALYRAAVEALAALPVRVLLTVGEGRDLGDLGRLPDAVHVERWVAQDDVLPHAAAFVCHGGFGSTLGALAHGLPFVVLPLFSADQWENAGAVARAGAGLALDADRATRRALDPPAAELSDALGPAVRRVLSEPSYRHAARRIADEMRGLPDADAVVGTLEALVADEAGRRSRDAARAG